MKTRTLRPIGKNFMQANLKKSGNNVKRYRTKVKDKKILGRG